MLKEVIKKKVTENEIWFKICKVLFYQEISCAKEIAKEIKCDPQKIRSQLVELKKSGIVESTGRIPIGYLARHKNGTFSKFYLLAEMTKEIMEEILAE